SRTTEEEYVKIDVLHRKFDTEVTAVSVPSSVGGGDTFSASVVVKNHLDATQENVELDVWFLGYKERVDLGVLAPGQTVTKSFTLAAPTEAGSFEVVGLSDPRALVHETTRENNRKVGAVSVTAPPEPEPGFDVSVGNAVIVPVDWLQDTVEVTATVWNGDADVSSLAVECSLGDATGSTIMSNLLALEERNNVSCFVALSELTVTGTVAFSFTADPQNLLDDGDTTNNTDGGTTFVDEQPAPFDLSTGYGELEANVAGTFLPSSMTIFNGLMDVAELSVTCGLGSANGSLVVANLVAFEERRVTCMIDATALLGGGMEDFFVCAHPADADASNDCQQWQEFVEAPSVENLVMNPSGEERSGISPLGWFDVGGSGVRFRHERYGSQDGVYHFWVYVTRASAENVGWLPEWSDVEENTRYYLSDFYQAESGTSMMVELEDSQGNTSFVMIGSVPSSPSVWQEAPFVFVTPSGTVRMRMFHSMTGENDLRTDNYWMSRVSRP
ncbi:MAG: hypothetical protein KC736_02595, partial [Candidatus Moranbacteria bacterium]|nr:hypothetical protein [Candidatus Moranbacteria bacterium]